MIRLDSIPRRVFLDTCVVNFILDHARQIHDGAAMPDGSLTADIEDVHALQGIFQTGQRAAWQLAVSPFTYFEILRTRDVERRSNLTSWFQQLWQSWRHFVSTADDFPTFSEAEHLRVSLLSSNLVFLPDVSDRVLLCDALVYRCDLFCTRDISTIIRHRTSLQGVPLQIATPREWWSLIGRYASLW